MKLAEALLDRGSLQSKLGELQTRLNNNAIVQQGESPAEDPKELMAQVEDVLSRLEELMTKINLTNARIVKDGCTMTQLLAKRDCLRQKISLYREFLNNASTTARRARGSEIKIEATVPVAELQKTVDSLSAQLRKLEITIQEINWITELQ